MKKKVEKKKKKRLSKTEKEKVEKKKKKRLSKTEKVKKKSGQKIRQKNPKTKKEAKPKTRRGTSKSKIPPKSRPTRDSSKGKKPEADRLKAELAKAREFIKKQAEVIKATEKAIKRKPRRRKVTKAIDDVEKALEKYGPVENYGPEKLEEELGGDDLAVGLASRRMREALHEARQRFPHASNPPLVHEYKPQPSKGFLGEVDGLWTVDYVRGLDTKTLIMEMLESLLPDIPIDAVTTAALGYGYWISVGLAVFPENMNPEDFGMSSAQFEAARYLRFSDGAIGVKSYWQRMDSREKILKVFFATIFPSSRKANAMFYNIEKKFKNNIARVLVRIHWNPIDKQPKNIE